MHVGIFKAFGYLSMVFYAVAFWVAVKVQKQNMEDVRIGRFLFVISVCAAMTWGLIHLRKWAAAFFAALMLAYGLWLIIGSIRAVPFPYLLINIPLEHRSSIPK